MDRSLFDRFDEDKTGALEKDEMREMMNEMGYGMMHGLACLRTQQR